MHDRIGVVGLGRMGRAIAERLGSAGVDVSAWNRTPRAGDGPTGVAVCATLRELTASSDILVLSLFDDEAVREVVEHLLTLDIAGRLLVDTSTVRPDTLAAFRDAATTRGAALVDAPISGGPEMVCAGTAGIFAGGETDDIARFLPIAVRIAGRVRHIGPLGSGAAAKIVNNMVLMGCWETLREAVALGRQVGLGLEPLVDLVFDGPAANPAMKSRREEILGRSDRVGFSVAGVIKDASVFLSVARDHGVPVPAVSAAMESYRAIADAGFAEHDLAAIIREAGRNR